ncbi:MAG: OsmC family protein, partial [Pararhodobacter sp.]
MLEYHVSALRIDSHGSEATTKEARIVLDTDMAGRADAFNPAEMLLASLAACILKSAERVTPVLIFDLRGIVVS